MQFDKPHFAAAVRGRRAYLGLTQAEVSERASISTVSLGQYERGDRVPSMPRIERLAAALETTVADLLSLPENGRRQ